MVGRMPSLSSMNGLSSDDFEKFLKERDAVMKKEPKDEKKSKKKEDVPKTAPDKGSFESTEDPEKTENTRKLKEFQEKVDSLTEKNQRLSKEKSQASAELESLRKSYAGEKNQREALEKKFEKLSADHKALSDDLARIRKQSSDGRDAIVESKEREIDSLKEKMSKLEESLGEARTRVSDMQTLIDSLQSKCSSLMKENEELKARPVAEERPRSESSAASFVERISSKEFSSPLFVHPIYKVTLTKNPFTITFRPDVSGRATCRDGIISLPVLERYLPFGSALKYEATEQNGTVTIHP